MRTLFIYAIASHNSSLVRKNEITDTLERARLEGYTGINIIKKTQLVAKKKELSKNFTIMEYPKASLEKAIKNAEACIVIGDGQTINRKGQIIDKILDGANKKNKLVMVMHIAV